VVVLLARTWRQGGVGGSGVAEGWRPDVRSERGVSAAAETGALKSLSPERRSRLLIDVARTRVQRRDGALTVRSLLESERVAPKIVHEHYFALQIVTDYWAPWMIRLGNARARAAMRPRPEPTPGLGGGLRRACCWPGAGHRG